MTDSEQTVVQRLIGDEELAQNMIDDLEIASEQVEDGEVEDENWELALSFSKEDIPHIIEELEGVADE